VLSFVCVLAATHAAYGQVTTANCAPAPSPAQCVAPGVCAPLGNPCIFVPGALVVDPLNLTAAEEIEARKAGNLLQCAINSALATQVNTNIIVCGVYWLNQRSPTSLNAQAFDTVGAGRTLSIRGLGSGASAAVIERRSLDPNDRFRFFFVESGVLHLENLTLRNGFVEAAGDNFGGAIYVRRRQAGQPVAELMCTNCLFDQNRADQGGAIQFESNAVPVSPPAEPTTQFRLLNCVFTSNLGIVEGGAVYTNDPLEVRGCRFENNSTQLDGLNRSTGRGGAIASVKETKGPVANLLIDLGLNGVTRSEFIGNRAGLGGAILCLSDGVRRINNADFTGNRADYPGAGSENENFGGGAIYAENATLIVNMCGFGRPFATYGQLDSPTVQCGPSPNGTNRSGGAIFCNATRTEIFNSLFACNSATFDGGAFRQKGSKPGLLRQCRLVGNTAGLRGGGVCVDSQASVALDDNVFLQNTAGTTGGGVQVAGTEHFLYNNVLLRNSATAGSAVASEAAATRIVHCTIADGPANIGAVHFAGTTGAQSELRNNIIGRRWTELVSAEVISFNLTGPQAAANLASIRSRTTYNDLQVGDADLALFGVGNINCPPLFENLNAGDVHLQSCSPCIDRASPESDPVTGADGVFSRLPSVFEFGPESGGGPWFFCSPALPRAGHCAGDFDDNGVASILDGNPAVTDVFGQPQTPRPSHCRPDMGADESPFFIWATMTVSCKKRSTTSGTCANPAFLADPANCSYCVGDNVVIEPAISGSCPTEFRVTQWRRLSTGAPCPPVNLGDPLPGTPVVEGGRFSIDPVSGRLCITGVQASDAGCYYAVLERQGCAGTNRAAFKNGNNAALPCVDRIAACACISVNTPPTISAQPPNRTLCEGDPTTISVTAAAPPGRVLCYQWFRRATPCDGSCPTPGSGGTRIQDLPANIRNGISGECTATLSFLPLRPEHEGYYYVRVVAWDPASGACPCPIDNGAVFDCAEVTSCCGFVDVVCKPTANVSPTSANVCVGGTQSFTATFTQCAGQDLPLVIQWYRRTFNGPSCSGQQTGEVAVGAPVNLPANNNDSHTLVIPNASLASEGCYFVRVSVQGFGGCSNDSPCRCLTVLPPPTVSPPNDRIVCENGTQTISAVVTYSGNPANLCYQWYRRTDPCVGTPTPADGTPVTNGGGISGANTPTLTFNPAVPAHAGYYFLCVRVCTFGGSAVNDTKCPAVCSPCARLDVRPPPVACQIECPGTPAGNECLICTGANATLQCGATQDPELCYQWQKRSPAGVWEDIPNQNGFRLVITAYNDAQHRGCYRVRVNYAAFAQGGNCPEQTDKCNAAISNVICLALDPNCCTDDCECKDNENEPDIRYALWRTGEWDGVNGEPSYEGAQEGTPLRRLIKSADDVYLDPYCMHRIAVFNGYMLVKAANPALPLNARLHIYKDCNGEPGELLHTLDPDCVQVRGPVLGQPEFRRVQFQFTPDCLWLRGGIYWFSLVGVGPLDDTSYEAYWATAGFPGNPSFPPPPDTPDGFLLGKRPVFMDEFGPWQEFDPCCHPCDDFEFCITGESCPIIWDNGKPDFGGADGPNPPPSPIVVPGTRSEKSNLPPRDSRAADQFVIKSCDSEEICYIEGYMLTNCTGFTAHLEIYENDCDEPYFRIPVTNSPYYHRTANAIEDLGLEGLRVGTTNVRAYRVSFCDWPIPLVLQPGRNYWLSLSIQDSFSANERAFFAHVLPPCDPCTGGNIYKINPGMEIAPGRQIPNWRSAGADFAFLIAARKRAGEPASSAGTAPPCPVDLNQNNTADVEDIFLFLSAFFAGCP
jgi:hypothetical protein